MAKCPNCEVQIAWDVSECGACLAVFGGTSEWTPIGESREEKEKLAQHYPGAYASVARDAANPYAPPQASVEDALAAPDQGRPFWVWAITIFYGLGTLWSLLSVFLIATNAITVDEASRAYWDKQSALDHAITVVNSIVSLCSLALLFFMRARAIGFMYAALVISVLTTLYQLAAKDLAAALAGSGGLVGLLIGFVLWIVVIWYANGLRRAGRLR
jgi:hypothetical protein